MTTMIFEHGTPTGYLAHLNFRITSCKPCREAFKLQRQEQLAKENDPARLRRLAWYRKTKAVKVLCG